MPRSPRIHLVTYASAAFRHRQWFLERTAKVNGVVDTVTSWNPQKLLDAGFETRCPGILLSEKGSGLWAWKPYIIGKKLAEIPEGDFVLYCDSGRRFPYKQITGSLQPLIDWMDKTEQDVMPGVSIPWKGNAARWTKRGAFIHTGMDEEAIYNAPQTQASFSLWRKSKSADSFLELWLNWCSCRELISDDPSKCGEPELPEFEEHRFDQSLLTLCCLKTGVESLDIGLTMPTVDTQHPTEIAAYISGEPIFLATGFGKILGTVMNSLEFFEKKARKIFKPKIN